MSDEVEVIREELRSLYIKLDGLRNREEELGDGESVKREMCLRRTHEAIEVAQRQMEDYENALPEDG